MTLARPLARCFTSPALWQALSRDARHPIARHFSRRRPGRRLAYNADGSPRVHTNSPLLAGSLLWGALLLIAAAFISARNPFGMAGRAGGLINASCQEACSTLLALPAWLMLFSGFYCALWIGRIAALHARQAGAGSLETVGLTPPGPAFVFLVMAKVALNEGDALAWLSWLRRALGAMVLFSLFMALCIASAQVGQVKPGELGAMVATLALLAWLIPHEHEQSVIIACLAAILVCARPKGSLDRTSAAVAGFALLQALSYALALAVALVIGALELGIVFAFFLLIREGMITALWKLLLRQCNEDDLLLDSNPWSAALGSEG